ncbi:MAG: hypothetical protein J6K29_07910 [Clostridia bacterium]|nr:hypothetical protein [Clostridia bacterium]
MDQQTLVTPYVPEKPAYIRTAVKTLISLLIFHGLSLLFHFMVMGNSDPYTMSSDAAGRIPTAMFLFSIVALFVLGDILVGIYFKDGKRKRAFLEATSAEKQGEVGAAEGHARYRRLAFTEALVCTLTTATLWLIPTLIYTVALATSGRGYGYTEASIFEKLFVGFIGLCEPFRNAWLGWLIGVVFMFLFYYFGRVLSHNRWEAERIRR